MEGAGLRSGAGVAAGAGFAAGSPSSSPPRLGSGLLSGSFTPVDGGMAGSALGVGSADGSADGIAGGNAGVLDGLLISGSTDAGAAGGVIAG